MMSRPVSPSEDMRSAFPRAGTAESTSSALFSTVASRDRQAMSSKGVIDGFEDIVGASRGSLERYWISFESSRQLTPLLSSKANRNWEGT